MRLHRRDKEVSQHFSTELISTIGKKMTEEYTKQRKIHSLMKESWVTFTFKSKSVTISEHTIEKFLEHFRFEEGDGIFMFRVENTQLSIIFHPEEKSKFKISGESEDQIWAEGIATVFQKLIEDFKPNSIQDLASGVAESSKIIEKTIIKEVDESSNKKIRFFKKYLYPMIVAIVAAIVGSLVLIYFKP